MLQQVLHEIETAQGALSLRELQQKLDIEQSTLEGMIQFLVQTGRLLDEEAAKLGTEGGCSCGSARADKSLCSYVTPHPKSFSLRFPKQPK